MEPHVAEVRAVVEALSAPADSPEDAAEAAIRALDKARTNRTLYAVVVNAQPAPYIYHSFGNRQEALKWARDNAVDVLGLSVWALPMFSRERVATRHTTSAHDKLMNAKKS